ncbi:glycosyltransferase family 2 protein [Candidatus Bathyarchaeota archaeon]|nr:MAG: glycosyltransferase family 2 protein [Candidatus Bathyarchaeota archaeon]
MMEQVLAEPSSKAAVELVQRFVKTPSLIAYAEPVRVSLILPIYNEGMILLDNVRNLTKTLNRLGLVSEILLCDDNSNDGTWDAAELASSDRVFHLRFSERIGKGATIKNALNAARGEMVVILDADIPVSLPELSGAISLMEEGHQFVIGVRRARPFTRTRRKFLSIGFNTLMNILFRTRVRDHQCGFKLIQRGAADRLFPLIGTDSFAFDAELIVKARSQGIPITQYEIDWLEKRNGLDSSLPAFRTTLAMLIDLIVLRTVSIRSRNLLGVHRVTNGFFKNPITGKTLPSEITMIGSENSNLLNILRKLKFQMSVQS